MSFASISDSSSGSLDSISEEGFSLERLYTPSAEVSEVASTAIALSPRPPSETPSLQVRSLSRMRASSTSHLSKWGKPFLMRLSVTERSNAIKAMASVTDKEITAVLQNRGDDLDREKVTAAILKAYLAGTIDEWEAAKLFLRCRCFSMRGKIGSYSLKSEEGRQLLLKGLLQDWDAKQLQQIADNSTKQETEFFFFQTESDPELKDIASFSIKTIPFHYGYIDYGSTSVNLIIPPKLWQQLLDIKFGKQAIKVEPVLGYSRVEKFSDYTKRIVNIPCDFTETPQSIHSLVDGKDNCAMYQHDSMFHAAVESANPHRAIWTELALKVKTYHKLAGIELLDRNCPYYVQGVDKVKAFWDSLEFNLQEIKADKSLRAFIYAFIGTQHKEWQEKYKVNLYPS